MVKLFEVLESAEFVDDTDYIVYEDRSREVIYFGASRGAADKAARESKVATITLLPIE